MEPLGYFDYNATTPLCPAARIAWCDGVDTHWMNPSSPYRAAARVNAHLDGARERMAELLSLEPERIVFNSGATEGNHAVFAHWAKSLAASAKVGVSPTEHPSVIESAKHFLGSRVVWLALDAAGAVDCAALVELLKQGELAAVSVMAANNETGLLNPWAEIAAACRATGCQYHCDASQWVGKLPAHGLGACDFVTICAHKFGGPKGVGCLICSVQGDAFRSLQGGAQQNERRAGTEDVAGVLSMVAALGAAREQLHGCTGGARDGFEASLVKALPGVEMIVCDAPRLWNTASVIMPEFTSERWIRGLERHGFWVSAGSACSSGKQGPSPVLAAMGVDSTAMRRVLRVSAGLSTTVAAWSQLCEAMVAVYAELRADAASGPSRVISI